MSSSFMDNIRKLIHRIEIIAFAVLFLSLIIFLPKVSHSFWKTCLKIDSSFYHQIIDPDIIEIGNNEYYAFVGVECEGAPRSNAFSNCANGCPLVSNSSVKIARNRTQVCEGDTIFVGNDQCTIGDIRKKRW